MFYVAIVVYHRQPNQSSMDKGVAGDSFTQVNATAADYKLIQSSTCLTRHYLVIYRLAVMLARVSYCQRVMNEEWMGERKNTSHRQQPLSKSSTPHHSHEEREASFDSRASYFSQQSIVYTCLPACLSVVVDSC